MHWSKVVEKRTPFTVQYKNVITMGLSFSSPVFLLSHIFPLTHPYTTTNHHHHHNSPTLQCLKESGVPPQWSPSLNGGPLIPK